MEFIPNVRYRCKYCSVIYVNLDEFIIHKKQFHYEEVVKDKRAKKKFMINQLQDTTHMISISSIQNQEVLEISPTPENNVTTSVAADIKALVIVDAEENQIQESDEHEESNNPNPEVKSSSFKTGLVYECPKCPFTTNDYPPLESHFKVHLLETSLPSPISQVQFADSFDVEVHAGLSHSKQNPQNETLLTAFQQNPLKKNCYDKELRTTKLFTKSGKRIPGGYACHYCNKQFDYGSVRNAHETHHTLPVKCPLCSKGTPNNIQLLNHFRKLHPGHNLDTTSLKHINKPSILWKESQQNSTSLHPERQHTKSGKEWKRIPGGYGCHYCNKQFDYGSVRNVHETYHTLPVKCPLCSKGMPNNIQLLNHFKTVHPGHNLDTTLLKHINKPGKRSKETQQNSTSLQPGRVVKLNRTYLNHADQSQSSLGQRISLKKLQPKTHDDEGKPQEFKCSVCEKKFPTRQGLSVHKLYHKKRKRCPYCAIKFSFNSINQHITAKHIRENHLLPSTE